MAEKGFWARFDPVVGQQKKHPIRNGLILLLLVSYGLWSGYNRHLLFFPHAGTVITADFPTAKDLRNATQVRVHGVIVGSVANIAQAPDGRYAVVTMRVNNIKDLNLRQDATAHIYWRTLLGFNMYVQIDPGSPSAPPLNPLHIPLSRTDSQVEFDDVLQALNTPARAGIQNFFKGFNAAFTNSPAVGSTVHALGPTMTNVAPGLAALRGANPGYDLPNLVSQTRRLVVTVQRNDDQLAGLINSGSVALGVTAARSADLGSMVDQAPAAEAQTQATMARLRTTLDQLDPLAQELRPGVRALAPAAQAAEPTLRTAVPLLNTARPTFRDLRPALTSLQSAAQIGTPLLQGYQSSVDRFNNNITAELAQPDSDLHRPLASLIGPFFSSVASIPGQFDAYGHAVYFEAGGGVHAIASMPCQLNEGTSSPPSTDPVTCQNLINLTSKLFGGGNVVSTQSALKGLSIDTNGIAGGHGSSTSTALPVLGAPAAGAPTSAGAAAPLGDGVNQVVGLIGKVLSGVGR
jgi:virulence factor Mce-like protein